MGGEKEKKTQPIQTLQYELGCWKVTVHYTTDILRLISEDFRFLRDASLVLLFMLFEFKFV